MRAYPTRFAPRAQAMGACCSACARGGRGHGHGTMSGLGDDATTTAAPTLDQRVAAIQASAAQYVSQDAFYKKLQIAAVLLIPLATIITKGILHVRRGDPLF